MMSTSAEHIVALNASGERRFYPRITPPLLIYVALGANNLGMLVNVSENGLLVSTPRGLTLNSVYRIALRLNGLPNAIRVHVRTVWTAESQNRAGLQLLDLCEHDREQIRKWGALQPAPNEALERWFSPENAGASPETTEPPPVLAVSPERPEPGSALVAPSPSCKDLRADKPRHDEFPVSRNAATSRKSARSSKPALIAWSAAMLAISLATAWPYRHSLFDRLLNRPAPYAKQGAPPVLHSPGYSPSLVALRTPATLAPSSIPAPKKVASSTVATATTKASLSNIPVRGGLEGKAPAAKPNLTASPTHSSEAMKTPDASESDVADSGSEPFPTNETIPAAALATPGPAKTQPSASFSAIDDSATKILSSDTSPSRSAITGSISNPTRTRDLSAVTPLARTSIAAPPPAFAPRSTAGRISYVERKSEPAVVHMDAPEAPVMELTLPSSRAAAFVVLPGERVLKSASVTMHIQRSVWVRGDHWWRHSHKKVALGELTSRIDPQISHVPSTSGTVTVQATIDKDGRVSNLKPLNGSFAFLPSVTRAIREWRYEPTYLDNKPVETQAQIEVDFHPPAARASRP